MRIEVIGAGMIGATVGKLWVEAGHEVRFASRHPEDLEGMIRSLGARASAGTAAEAADFGEVVLLAVPLKALPALSKVLTPLLGAMVVLDASNAYVQRDGNAARDATHHPRGSAGWAEAMFAGSRWVKAFNTVYFETLAREAHRKGDRVGIPLAGDDPKAVDVAAQLVRDAGFDPVPIGDLSRGKEIEPGTRPYNTGMTGRQLREIFQVPPM